jgi:hypothetical protein
MPAKSCRKRTFCSLLGDPQAIGAAAALIVWSILF